MSDSARMPRKAAWLGYTGLIPFAVSAAACWLGGDTGAIAASVFRAYAAAILAFLGGIPWGLALGQRVEAERLAVGVLPALVAWLALVAPPAPGIGVLALSLAAFYGWDRARNLMATPVWFRRLRRDLTAGALVCHAVAIAAILAV